MLQCRTARRPITSELLDLQVCRIYGGAVLISGAARGFYCDVASCRDPRWSRNPTVRRNIQFESRSGGSVILLCLGHRILVCQQTDSLLVMKQKDLCP